jgi:hypothetical protein
MTGAGRSTSDYWVRYSLGAMLFAGVFDRYPRLKVGSVDSEKSDSAIVASTRRCGSRIGYSGSVRVAPWKRMEFSRL